MSRKYKFRNPEGMYFITYTVIRWIDVFTRNLYRDILLDSFVYCRDKKGLRTQAYVIMTNHVHMIVSASEGYYLENIMRDLKKFTSVEIIKAIKNNPTESRKMWLLQAFAEEGKQNANNTSNQFWQQDNHPIELYNNEMIEQKLNYIHNNPVKSGFVEKPEDYVYSSARDYAGIKGLIEIEIIE
jgi:REP element-mobilizing transposase RayT